MIYNITMFQISRIRTNKISKSMVIWEESLFSHESFSFY